MLTHDVTGGEFQNLGEVDIQDVFNSHAAELIEGDLEQLTAFIEPEDVETAQVTATWLGSSGRPYHAEVLETEAQFGCCYGTLQGHVKRKAAEVLAIEDHLFLYQFFFLSFTMHSALFNHHDNFKPRTPASFQSVPAQTFLCLIIIYLHITMFCTFLITQTAFFSHESLTLCIVVSVFIGLLMNVTSSSGEDLL